MSRLFSVACLIFRYRRVGANAANLGDDACLFAGVGCIRQSSAQFADLLLALSPIVFSPSDRSRAFTATELVSLSTVLKQPRTHDTCSLQNVLTQVPQQSIGEVFLEPFWIGNLCKSFSVGGNELSLLLETTSVAM